MKKQALSKLVLFRRLGHLTPILSLTCSSLDGWDIWSPWTPCSSSCGGGEMKRSRFCLLFGEEECVGNEHDSKACNQHMCPGQWRIFERNSVRISNVGRSLRLLGYNFFKTSQIQISPDFYFHSVWDQSNQLETNWGWNSQNHQIVSFCRTHHIWSNLIRISLSHLV